MVSGGKRGSEVEDARRKRRQLVTLRRRKLTRYGEESEEKGQSRLAPESLVLMGPLTKTGYQIQHRADPAERLAPGRAGPPHRATPASPPVLNSRERETREAHVKMVSPEAI